ncbi:uncharacterized protein LOC144039763 [Vanacampus margaritifer]
MEFLQMGSIVNEVSVNITCPPPPPPPPVETSLDAVLNISTFNTEPRELMSQLRETLKNLSLPFNISVDLILTSLNLTTVCYRDFNGQEQCQCEDEYLWPCDICETYGACNNTSLQSCNCINGIPSDGQYCERSVNITCPPPPPVETSLDAVLNISTFNTEPRELMSQLRETLKNLSLPFNISVDLILTSLNLTTVCYRDFNGQEQCQCEDEYLWPCDICETYGACNNTSLQSCNCINGIPSDGQYCERSVNITCPPPPPVETSLDAVLNISTFNTEPRELMSQLRETLKNLSLPFNISVDLILTSLNLTTVCYRDFNGQEQCQCEDEYLWPCDICETYGACNNTSLQSCNCINGIPSDGQYCERSVNITCPPPPPAPPVETSLDAVLNISTFNTEPRELMSQLRETLKNLSLPFNISVDLILTSLNLTTVCYRDFNGQEQCQCEDEYLWPCDICETYGACNNTSLQSCNCINGIPSDGQYCERSVNITCPPPPPPPPVETSLDAVLNISTFNTEPRELMSQLRETLKNLSLPFNISVDLILTSLNLTTVCYRDFNGQEQCQCEDEYLWPCDICETYGACNNTSLQSCNCINGIPSDGQYCERSVNITCPPPPPAPPVESNVSETYPQWTLFST